MAPKLWPIPLALAPGGIMRLPAPASPCANTAAGATAMINSDNVISLIDFTMIQILLLLAFSSKISISKHHGQAFYRFLKTHSDRDKLYYFRWLS
jgi:hypothetical protein